MTQLRIGLQMISVKDLTPKDIVGVLREVAEVGYEGVEFARGFFGKTAEEIRTACDAYGLVPVSDHVEIERMRADLGQVIGNAKTLGMKYIAFPGPGMDTHGASEAQIAALIRELKDLTRVYSENGIQACLHSPMEMFEPDGRGERLYDRVLREIPDLMAQIDTAWALAGGVDPAEYILKYAGRCDVIHIKDFRPPIPTQAIMAQRRDAAYKLDANIGEGVQDVPRIVDAARRAGVRWIIVEHMEKEVYEDSIQAVRVSLGNLRKYI